MIAVFCMCMVMHPAAAVIFDMRYYDEAYGKYEKWNLVGMPDLFRN